MACAMVLSLSWEVPSTGLILDNTKEGKELKKYQAQVDGELWQSNSQLSMTERRILGQSGFESVHR